MHFSSPHVCLTHRPSNSSLTTRII